MKSNLKKRSALVVAAVSALALVAAACTPPSSADKWEFKATNVTINDSQDEVPGTCWMGVCKDEPYVINIATRVKIGSKKDSASGFVVSSRDNNPEDMPAGTSSVLETLIPPPINHTYSGAKVVYPNVQRLDVADLLNTNNKLEVMIIYTWVMEEDQVPVNAAATSVMNSMVDALNETLDDASVPNDPNVLLNLILNNLGNAFTIMLSNIPLLGLGDDVGGGAINVGIAAKGGLATIINNTIGTADIPEFEIPVLDLPPSIKHVNIFAMGGTKTFTGQAFNQYHDIFGVNDGTHTYDFQAKKG